MFHFYDLSEGPQQEYNLVKIAADQLRSALYRQRYRQQLQGRGQNIPTQYHQPYQFPQVLQLLDHSRLGQQPLQHLCLN